MEQTQPASTLLGGENSMKNEQKGSMKISGM